MLSPRLLFRRADGNVVTKEQFLLKLKDKSPFRERSSEDLRITVIGARACAIVTVVTTKENGDVNHYRNARFFIFADQKWQLESWFN